MTVTVKLDALLEERLRQRAAATGSTASDVIRDALQRYLALPPQPDRASAFALGAGLFGRYRGPADLTRHRKAEAAELWAAKHGRRG